MEINDFYWLDEIIDKLSVKHHVEPWEVEEVFKNFPRFRFRQKGNREGEDLIVLFIYKPPRPDRPLSQALIVSARDMADSERKQYERK